MMRREFRHKEFVVSLGGHLHTENSLLLVTFLALLHSCNHFRITHTHADRENGKDIDDSVKEYPKLYEIQSAKSAQFVRLSHNSEEFGHQLQYLLIKYYKISHLIYPCQYTTHRKGHCFKGSL